MLARRLPLAIVLSAAPLACAPQPSTAGAAPDGVTAARASARPSCGQATPYFEFQVERPAERRSGPKPPSRTGRYSAQYIVDESGRADSASFVLLEKGNRSAAEGQRWSTVRDSASFHAAWRAVASSTFRPAEIGGCTVRMLLQEPAIVTPPAGGA